MHCTFLFSSIKLFFLDSIIYMHGFGDTATANVKGPELQRLLLDPRT